jgi:hypothetical protein
VRCIAVASHQAQSGYAIKLAEETTLATWLVAAMSLTSMDTTADGLELRPEDSLLAPLAEDHAIAALATKDRDPTITRENFGSQVGYWLGYSPSDSDLYDSARNTACSTPCRAALQDPSVLFVFSYTKRVFLY